MAQAARPTDRTLLIFAGGRATRLGGANKALLDIGGTSVVNRLLAELAPLAAEHLALTNDRSLESLPGVRLIDDPQPHAGVLPALANGLANATGGLCLAVACDMPFASRTVFEYLLALQHQEAVDVVIPRVGGYLEPMHAVYRRDSVLSAIRAALARGEKRMISYFPAVRVREVGEDELRGIHPTERAFFNVNTPEDLDAARKLTAE